MKNGGCKWGGQKRQGASEESRIPRSSADAPSETLMNSRTDMFLRLPPSHKCVRTCHRQTAAVLLWSLFIPPSLPPLSFSLSRPVKNYYSRLSSDYSHRDLTHRYLVDSYIVVCYTILV